MKIYYHKITGQIGAWEIGTSAAQDIPDHCVVEVDADMTPDPLRLVVDVETKVLRHATQSETAFFNLPAEYEVRAARSAELITTDWTAVAEHLSDADRSAWRAYRQALRDLGARSNPVEMIHAWPPRPDGSDAIPLLRARV